MRRILVALLTAALVVIGLSAVLVGTASAATPVLTADSQVCVAARDSAAKAQSNLNRIIARIGNSPVSDADRILRDKLQNDLEVARDNERNVCGGNGGNNGGNRTSCADYARDGIYDIPRSDPRYRDNLDRDRDGLACERNEGNGGNYGGPRYNDCGEYNRNNIYDLRRGDARYNDSWDRNRNGVACDRGDVIVSDDGRCVTFRDQNRDYGTRYNTTYNQRIDRARSVNSDGGTRITDSERRAISDAADLRDYRSRWQTSTDELRTICNDPTPEVIIVNPTPAPSVTVTQAPPPPPAVSAPAPSSSGSIPSGSVNTGGSSVAFTLAHNRAV